MVPRVPTAFCDLLHLHRGQALVHQRHDHHDGRNPHVGRAEDFRGRHQLWLVERTPQLAEVKVVVVAAAVLAVAAGVVAVGVVVVGVVDVLEVVVAAAAVAVVGVVAVVVFVLAFLVEAVGLSKMV